MPSVIVNSSNINIFAFKATFDLLNRNVVFDASLTSYYGSGINNVLGIAFYLEDSDGVVLASIDWTDPQIPTPSVSQSYTLDLSAVNYAFMFQTYKIVGAIKDAGGAVYQTQEVYKKVCQPVGFNDSGYVPGSFQVIPDCVNNNITVKEFTLLVYNNLTPTSVTKSGYFYYPTGTITAIAFANTPFSNNQIYTGQYKVACNTAAIYDLNDDIYVLVTYVTDSVFDVFCGDRMGDVMCCIEKVQDTYLKNCNTSIGQNAKQLLDEISIPLFIGVGKEINGQDASSEAAIIKKKLNCDCGVRSIGQNELTPVNPSIYSIVLNGAGGTTVPSAVVTGSTKTYTIASNVYQVVKGDPSDTAFSISIDTSVSGTVKYKISFNYTILSSTILTTIGNNDTLLNQFNQLVSGTGGVSLSGLNGKCIIDLTQKDYVLTQSVNLSTYISNVVINGTTYSAPSNLFATDFVGVKNWLDSLSLGTFTVVVSSGTLLIMSNDNSNVVSTMTFTTPDVTTAFISTSVTLVTLLQAMIDYMCGLTSLQVTLGANLSLCLFDYNGIPQTYDYTSTQKQSDFNLGISQAMCNIVSRINTLTGITCDKLKSIFIDRPGVVFGADDRLYGTLGGNCSGVTDYQAANMIIAAINKYSDVKTAFCNISCSTPGTCPDVSGINASVVSGNIGIYGITWNSTPSGTQTATVRYRISGGATWNIATNSLGIFPNGNLTGTSPYTITGLVSGTTYDISINNNCGGAGFVTQITIPTTTIYSGSFLLDTVIYNICGESPVTLYSTSPFATGVTMYTDIGLTTAVNGFTYITSNAGGNIFNINSSTGVVGADTGTSCTTGTGGSYILGNSTSSICDGTVVTLYTNGVFTVGGTLYTDSALTTPQTGYSYVLNQSNGQIYNLNSSTGAIGVSTGLSCSSTVQIYNQMDTMVISNVTGISGFTLSTPVNPGIIRNGTHTAFTNAISVTLSGTDVAGHISLYIGVGGGAPVLVECQEVPSSGVYNFGSHSYNSIDIIAIYLQNGSC